MSGTRLKTEARALAGVRLAQPVLHALLKKNDFETKSTDCSAFQPQPGNVANKFFEQVR